VLGQHLDPAEHAGQTGDERQGTLEAAFADMPVEHDAIVDEPAGQLLGNVDARLVVHGVDEVDHRVRDGLLAAEGWQSYGHLNLLTSDQRSAVSHQLLGR